MMNTVWHSSEYVVIDVETTSFDIERARICEIAAVVIRDGKVTSETYETLVNPRVPIEDDALSVHGISNELVANAPEFIQVRRGFERWLLNRTIVAHYAEYDIGRLKHEMRFHDFGLVLDTCLLAVHCRRSRYIRKLHTLVRKYDLTQCIESTYPESETSRAHRAGYDAHAAAHLFVRLIREHCDPEVTLNDLAEMCRS